VSEASETVRISLWSGPRNISTALMYSFAQRSDTRVFDEPLYAHYLVNSDARGYHPGAEEVVASMESKGETVVREILLGPHNEPLVFFKNMTHHLVEIRWDFLLSLKNVLLTRDPRDMLPSYAAQVNRPTLADTGYRAQVRLLEYLRERGQEPPVLEAREVLLNPRGVLTELCRRLDIPFDEDMLHWRPGSRPEDGVWAKYWYAGVHESSGFQPYRPRAEPVPDELTDLLAECLPYYERLAGPALRA
jgi:hypothetical protein